MVDAASGSGKETSNILCLNVPNAAMTERDHGALSEVGQGGWHTRGNDPPLKF